MPTWRRIWACTLVLAGTAHAQPLPVRHLTPADGLSSLRADAVAQPPGAFLWIASGEALDRYDGVRPVPHSRGGLAGLAVERLAASASGALWGSTAGAVWRWDPEGTTFARIADRARLGGAPRALLAHGEGAWVGTTRGLRHLHPGGRVGRPRGLPADTVFALASRRRDLVAAIGGQVVRLDARTGTVHGRRALPGVRALAVTPGAVWAGDAQGRVHALHPATLQPLRPPVEIGAPIGSMEASARGHVWVGTRGEGLFAVDRDGSRPVPLVRQSDGRTLRPVHVMDLDERDGSLWMATLDGVLHADVSPPRFRPVVHDPAAPGGLRVPAVMTVHASRADPETIWVGTMSGGLHRYHRPTGEAEQWFADSNHPLSVLFAIHEAESGDLWLGGTVPTVYRFRPGSAPEPVALAGAPGGYITDLVPSLAHPGDLWVTTSAAGIWRLTPESRTATPFLRDSSWVWTVHEPPDEPGWLYAATNRGGLLRIEVATGRAERLAPTACPLDDRLLSLASTPDGTLWIGSFENRVVRYDRPTGTCRVYTAADGVPDESVGGVMVDGRGIVWISTNAGLARLDPDTHTITRFSASDGVPDGGLFFSARDHTPSGEILVGGAGGFTAFQPEAIAVDEAPASVRFTGVRVDGEPVPLAEALGGLSLRHDRNDVEVRYASLDLREPAKTRYRVQLVGADDGWRVEGPQVRYPLLPPGRYTLRVAASNRDGYWSAPTELAIRIRPPYWRTPWFWALVAALLGAVAYAAHRYRVEQLLRVERTRRRIADDLHDDIGSKISSVALRLDAVERSPGLPADERARVARLGATARAVVGDLRDTVWLVDAGHDDLAAVADRMEQFATQTLGPGHVTRGDVPASAISMAARRDLYFLFTEALHNAVRHAQADTVAVAVGCDADAFTVSVADDGCGFEGAAGGRGMTTMRRRADALGGTLSVDSAPGRGTRVAFRLPLASRVLRRGADGL